MADPVLIPWLRRQASGEEPLTPLDLRNTRSLLAEIDALQALASAEAPAAPSAALVTDLEAQLVAALDDAKAALDDAKAARAEATVAKNTLAHFEQSLANLKLDVSADPQVSFSGKPGP